MFKTWAIAQAFCSKTAKFRPLRIHPKSTQIVVQGVRNNFKRVQQAFQRVLSDFQDLQNPPCSNHGLQPRLFAQKRPNFDPCEFLRNRHKQSRKELEIILRGFRWRFRKFGAISRTCQNRPCSKPWAIAQAFCSKSANFRPLRIQRKSKLTVAQGVKNHFRRVQVAFQRVWSDFQDLQKSAMFKPWAIAQAFCSKTAKFRPLRIHPKSTQTVAQGVRNHFRRVQVAVSESLERFPGLAKIGHVQNPGLQPRLFAQKRPNFDPCEFIRNRHKQLRKELEIILGGFRRRFREFGAISRTCQNRPCSKPWAIAQAFCSKTAKFRPLRIHPKSTQTVVQGVRNNFKRVQQAFQRVLSDFQDLQKSAMFKPWAIAQAFCSKTAKFRPLRIHPKSTQTIAQGVRNHFRRVQVAFQRVWSDFQDLQKSAMFKTMGYSPGFLLKNGQFSTLANSTEIDTNSRARSQKSF